MGNAPPPQLTRPAETGSSRFAIAAEAFAYPFSEALRQLDSVSNATLSPHID
jgi:hypothetical protein